MYESGPTVVAGIVDAAMAMSGIANAVAYNTTSTVEASSTPSTLSAFDADLNVLSTNQGH